MANQPKNVFVKQIPIGENNPVVIQTMLNTPVNDIEQSAEQAIRVWQSGAKLVRVAIPSIKDIDSIRILKQRLSNLGFEEIPLVADIHFLPKIALKAAEIVDKVRINPGNFAEQKGLNETEQARYIRQKLQPLVEIAKQRRIALRIGVNHGSLSNRMLERYGDTPEGMVASAIEYIHHLEDLSFYDIIVSLKSSNPIVMIQANRLLIKEMQHTVYRYPIHLGVTEAGDGLDGRIKSAVGIGTLLTEGIGETIRVSLTEPPEHEIPVARHIISISNDSAFVAQPQSYDGYFLQAATSHSIQNIGGKNKPVVILPFHSSLSKEIQQPDFVYSDVSVEISLPLILPWAHFKKQPNTFPLLYKTEYHIDNIRHLPLVFLKLSPEESLSLQPDNLCFNTVLIIHLNQSKHSQQVLQKVLQYLKTTKISNPVIFKYDIPDTDETVFSLKAAIMLGRNFVDGYGNGLFLDTLSSELPLSIANAVAFGILQATRRRITQTEYIACPSCGRTLFNLEKTVSEIRKKTAGLTGIKIAVMGCIVNGIGEMADADYGYVGASPGKITLYKNKTIIRKNIDEAEAVDALIELIKKDMS